MAFLKSLQSKSRLKAKKSRIRGNAAVRKVAAMQDDISYTAFLVNGHPPQTMTGKEWKETIGLKRHE